MKIDSELISKLENLAKLYLTPEEKKALQQDLSNIMTMVDDIQEVDVTNVAPLRHMSQVVDRFRPDVAQPSLNKQKALKNAPASMGDYFVVPNVLESGKKRAQK